LAARVIVAIENPQDIIVQSARPYGQRAVLKFAQYTNTHAIAGRHTPGTFTNQLQTSFSEPRLLILTDPRTDHQVICLLMMWFGSLDFAVLILSNAMAVSLFYNFDVSHFIYCHYRTCSLLKNLLLGTFQQSLSVTLTLQCGMLTLVSQQITRESTALGVSSGCWQGWFCRCVVPSHLAISGM